MLKKISIARLYQNWKWTTFVIIWLFAVSALLVRIHFSLVDNARSSAETDQLTHVAQLLNLAPSTSKADLYRRLESFYEEHEVANREHIARKLGLSVDWEQIFQRIQTLEEPEREATLRVIAMEYDLPADTAYAQIRKIVMLKSKLFRAKIATPS